MGRPFDRKAAAQSAGLDDQGQTLFARAALDPLHAASLERVVGERSRGLPVGDAHLEARRRLHRALDALGGVTSPAGSCAWAVLGEGRSLREWTLSQGWRGKPLRQEAAQGVLVATLGVLAGQWARSTAAALTRRACARDPARREPHDSRRATIRPSRGTLSSKVEPIVTSCTWRGS